MNWINQRPLKYPYKRRRSKHHLTPRSRKGGDEASNLLVLWRDQHDVWHYLFGNRTIEEIIALLERVRKIKGRRKRE